MTAPKGFIFFALFSFFSFNDILDISIDIQCKGEIDFGDRYYIER